MKRKLIVLSLCPLFILTFIQYFPWTKLDIVLINLNNSGMYKEHFCLCLGLLICFIWVIYSLLIYMGFRFNMMYDRVEGYEIVGIVEEKDAGLNFFLALILPLLINDIRRLDGLVMMIILVVFIFLLLYKTNLYYQNPILVILDYRIYRFKFRDNERVVNQEYIGIAFNKITGKNTVDYKIIEDNVIVIRQKETNENAKRGIH